MKKIILTVDDEFLTKYTKEVGNEEFKDINEQVEYSKKCFELIKNCPPSVGIQISLDGIDLELKKSEYKDKEDTNEKAEFVQKYLLNVSFTQMFMWSQLIKDVEIVETDE